MTKRSASEVLDESAAVGSPASKKSRLDDSVDLLQANGIGHPELVSRPRADTVTNGDYKLAPSHSDSDDEPDETLAPILVPTRQLAPAEGYDDLYLDTIDRGALDFDFEKLCSVSLSNINVYACLVCGRYFQGRGPRSHAYFHSLDDDHHVFINLQTQHVYVLPEGYEVHSRALDDIKYVSDPRYTRREVAALDRAPHTAWTLAGRSYTPGYVGMNNIKENDYLNVAVQALAHVAPMRNYLLLEDLSVTATTTTRTAAGQAGSELARRCGELVRKIWNPRAFRAHVSPHELLQEVALRSNKRFTLTAQSDPADFLLWFLNNLHLDLGGSRTRPGSSIVQRVFQGRLRVESQAIKAREDAGDRLRFEEAVVVKTEVLRFMQLTLDLPPPPLFQDELDRSIIPQVPLGAILAKYDGRRAQDQLTQRKRYRLLHPLPPYLVFHVKRFSQNKFVTERNPTIVTFDVRGLDMSPYVEPDPAVWPPDQPVLYDLVANVVHEAVRSRDDASDRAEERKTWKIQLLDKGRNEWVLCQDLFVDKIHRELLYLGETYLQIWEKRRSTKRKTGEH